VHATTREKEKAMIKAKKKAGDSMPGFLTGEWWKVLSTDIQVEELSNSNYTLPRAPTVAEKEA